MAWSGRAIIFLIILVMFLLGVEARGLERRVPISSEAAYWKDKYDAQKRKSLGQYKRILVLNKRIRVYRGSATPLENVIVKWVLLAECESGNDWKINSGNGYYGGVQFSKETWRSYGGMLFGRQANFASPIQQVAIAERVLADQGRGAWPGCTKQGAW
jgi:hypothetical protein